VRRELQLAEATVDQAANLLRRLNNEPVIESKPKPRANGHTESDTTKKTAAATAAEVADRLAASSHSQQIMSSVLSSFAAQEVKGGTNGGATTETPTAVLVTPQAVFPGPPAPVMMGLNYGYGPVVSTQPLQPVQAGIMGPTRPIMPLGQMIPMSQQSQSMQFALQQVGPPGFRPLQPALPGMPFYHPPSQ
jgi:regulator of Ty1 transposition protein 103